MPDIVIRPDKTVQLDGVTIGAVDHVGGNWGYRHSAEALRGSSFSHYGFGTRKKALNALVLAHQGLARDSKEAEGR